MNAATPRAAIVTGASRGIGRACAEALAAAGYDLVVAARSAADLDDLVRQAGAKTGRTILAHAVDLRDPPAARRLVDAAIAAFGRIDVVVNNAGATKRGDFLELGDDDWTDGFALKLFGAVRLTRAAWPHLRTVKGQIVNIIGTGGRTPSAEFTIGGAVNSAMMNLTKALADKGLADGIRVNGINPSLIKTDRLTVRIRRYADEHKVSMAQAMDELARHDHALRFGEPEEIASIVTFLVCGGGQFINGGLIDADSGSTQGL
ncbi:MAG: SDR family NAD(P)-dependent oxidoreductase [Alphaproteobacteria bacterium]|nr:SDR family NAD(P)-dependent oxidoreductase [Alphaproteobacteria bacterium]